MAHTWQAKRVVVTNAPAQWHVLTGQWGETSVAVCNSKESATLMASVLELLEACKGLVRETSSMKLHIKKDLGLILYREAARRAISKAEGR